MQAGTDGDERAALEVRLERAVAGGVVLGRDAGGRVVLARGGIPGERVLVEPERVRPTLVKGTVLEVLEASPDRVTPPCPLVEAGCGGCDLQHASLLRQRSMRIEVLRDALSHLAGTTEVPVEQIEPSPGTSQRTTMRLAVTDGRLGLRHRRSHEVVPVPSCLVAHPLLAPVLAEGRFGRAREVTVRASVSSGEVLVVVSRSARGCAVPEGVRLVGTDELAAGTRAWITEQVDGHELRVSAGSFFQSGPHAAASLGRAVGRALDGFDPGSDRLVDLYGGIGLFTVLLGARRAEVVERSATAVADARRNTEHVGARVVKVAVGSWSPSPADAVVADPARTGLGAEGVAAIAATGASRVALVSCDPAALGRDVSLLADAGYVARGVEVVDMFPHTHHLEAVTTLWRAGTSR